MPRGPARSNVTRGTSATGRSRAAKPTAKRNTAGACANASISALLIGAVRRGGDPSGNPAIAGDIRSWAKAPPTKAHNAKTMAQTIARAAFGRGHRSI